MVSLLGFFILRAFLPIDTWIYNLNFEVGLIYPYEWCLLKLMNGQTLVNQTELILSLASASINPDLQIVYTLEDNLLGTLIALFFYNKEYLAGNA